LKGFNKVILAIEWYQLDKWVTEKKPEDCLWRILGEQGQGGSQEGSCQSIRRKCESATMVDNLPKEIGIMNEAMVKWKDFLKRFSDRIDIDTDKVQNMGQSGHD